MSRCFIDTEGSTMSVSHKTARAEKGKRSLIEVPMGVKGLATSICFLLLISVAGAQPRPTEEIAREMLALALDNIQRGRCEGSQPCAPATAAEKANPPLTNEEAQKIILQATLSAIAERCGLDWRQRSFLPMMAYWRTTEKKTERQMTLVGLLHGIMVSKVRQALADKPCTEQERRDLDARLRRSPS